MDARAEAAKLEAAKLEAAKLETERRAQTQQDSARAKIEQAEAEREARLRAIHSFWALPEAASLAAAHKRVRNVLKQAGDGGSDVDAAKFESDAESVLYAALNAVNANPATDYAERLKQLAGLKAPVDAFFTGVMVMADDAAVRANRLALLRQLDRVCREVADISCLPG